ncbi:MAG: type IV toxin-antitoxin system AbiEi family antitoxin domain-containing protein [Thermoguttaceae bacterium]|nr:type IV toxin-antitoxin system AbiEi family antitoxin domain-containing protein [Thermoguttaceae bacterium]
MNFRTNELIRIGELPKKGLSRYMVYKLLAAGKLERVSRGVYRAVSGDEFDVHPDIVDVVSRKPDAVLCLVSALDWYGLTTRIPFRVSIAVRRGCYLPADMPDAQIYYFSDASLKEGVRIVYIDRRRVKITTPEKTIADCFKFRNRLGMETVLEALRLYRRQMEFKPDKLMEFAKVCRVANVIRPYLEMIQ